VRSAAVAARLAHMPQKFAAALVQIVIGKPNLFLLGCKN
jgi:hypothetical protein